MGLLVIGVNHKTATVSIREQAALVPEKVPAFLQYIKEHKIAKGIVALSTCNRTEFYIDSLRISRTEFEQLWADYSRIDPATLAQTHYVFEGDAVPAHLFKVASGLDSLVLGEPQIMGQLKDSLEASVEKKLTSKFLHRLFQHAFHVAKNVRTQTNIGAFTVSVAYTAVQLAKQIFDLKDQKVLLVGAGETIELVARHLLEAGVRTLSVANRTHERAQAMLERLGVPMAIHGLNELPNLIEHADIIISSTAANEILITKAMAQQALKKRKNKPILMVDIAVPRDIDAHISELDDVYLYSVDDLNTIVEKNYQSRESAAKEAQGYLHEGLDEWTAWCAVADFGDRVNVLDEYMAQQKMVTVRKITNLLHKGVPVEAALAQFANQLTSRSLHPVIAVIKRLEEEGEQVLADKIIKEFTK